MRTPGTQTGSAISRRRFRWLLLVPAAVLGCGDLTAPSSRQNQQSAKPKTTDQIGEFDPAAGNQVVDNKVNITNPITGPLEALQPLKRQLTSLGIQPAVDRFHASEGRYPDSLDEFMTRIIRENQIRLPALPPGLSYQYDVANHQLVIVQDNPGQGTE